MWRVRIAICTIDDDMKRWKDGDLLGVWNNCQHSRGYTPRGKTPVVELNAKLFSINMVSAISKQGLLTFMMCKEKVTV